MKTFHSVFEKSLTDSTNILEYTLNKRGDIGYYLNIYKDDFRKDIVNIYNFSKKKKEIEINSK